MQPTLEEDLNVELNLLLFKTKMLLFIVFVLYHTSAECNLEEILVEDDNVHYKIKDQTCLLSEIKSKYIGKRVGELVLVNSKFTFDADLSMGECNHCLEEGMYNFFLIVDNSTVFVNFLTKIYMVEYVTGEMIVNNDLHVRELLFMDVPWVMLETIKTMQSGIFHVGSVRFQQQFTLTYSVPKTLRLADLSTDVLSETLEICDNFEFSKHEGYCPNYRKKVALTQNCNQQCEICTTVLEMDRYCRDFCDALPIDCNEKCPHGECPTCDCPQCNCPVCEQCQQCQECPVCKNTTESSTVKRDIRVSFDAFAQHDGKISLVAEYNDQSEDRRGVIEIDNVILFVFEARYSHYSNDAYEKQWYYIKDGHFFILPRNLINEIVIIDALSLSSQFDFSELTYMSTSDGFYVFYDDDTYDIFVASPYDFFNSYKLNKDGTFTYMFTSIFKKKYSVGDAYNGRVITAIV